MTPRDVLAEIEQRADLAKRDESLIWLGDHDEALKLAIPEARERLIEKDAPAMVAALRAVLKIHQAVQWPGMEIPTLTPRVICGECSDEDFVDWPCSTVRAITEKLSDG